MRQHKVPRSLGQELFVPAKEGVIWGQFLGLLCKAYGKGHDLNLRLTQQDPYTLIDYAQILTRQERPPDT